MSSFTNDDVLDDDDDNALLDTTYCVGDRVKSPSLMMTRHGIIMPSEWLTITRITDYIIEAISDNFIPVKLSRL